MSILSDNWTMEHLIRHQRIASPIPPAEKSGVQSAREQDRDAILPLAKTMSQAEIVLKTGLSANRVYQICRFYEITCCKNYNANRRREGGRL